MIGPGRADCPTIPLCRNFRGERGEDVFVLISGQILESSKLFHELEQNCELVSMVTIPGRLSKLRAEAGEESTAKSFEAQIVSAPGAILTPPTTEISDHLLKDPGDPGDPSDPSDHYYT